MSPLLQVRMGLGLGFNSFPEPPPRSREAAPRCTSAWGTGVFCTTAIRMLDVQFGEASDPGKVRPNNDDATGPYIPVTRHEARSHGYLFAAADGVRCNWMEATTPRRKLRASAEWNRWECTAAAPAAWPADRARGPGSAQCPYFPSSPHRIFTGVAHKPSKSV